ncbi:uncharacterized protein isoform X2 [Rhodnius prolixus]|uniref:uncharacterized protein isoform X2 n=1 Tax=Rhodnius prolixus TaxID=13249 RepID=UPI003D187D5D
MASNCPTIKSISESDKTKRSRTIPRIDANLILNLSSLITTENEETCSCLRKIARILSSSLKHSYESDEFFKYKEILIKLIQDCFLRIPLILKHCSGQKSLSDVNTNLRDIVKVLLEIANNGTEFRNYYFTNLFQMIMVVLFSKNEKIEFATQKMLFLVVKEHLAKLTPKTQKHLMNANNDVLELLAIWLPNSADYEIQEAILETLMLFSIRSKRKYDRMKNWFKNYPNFFQAIDNLCYNYFIESSREFLMVVNKIVTSSVKVYILPCIKAYADDFELQKPQSERYKKFWVDFSVRSGNIQLYCSAGTGQWGKFSIDFSNVNGINCVDEKTGWKVKIEFICPLEIYIYSSKKFFKTITLYFPYSLQFQEVQNKFFFAIFPHIYKVEKDNNSNVIKTQQCDKTMFENSFFSRSSVVSSIRPVSSHRTVEFQRRSSNEPNTRTSTPKRATDERIESKKNEPSSSNTESMSRTYNIKDQNHRSTGLQLISKNQNELSLNCKAETGIQSVKNLKEVFSDEELSDDVSTPTGEIYCEQSKNGINQNLEDIAKNNLQNSTYKEDKKIIKSVNGNLNMSQNCVGKTTNNHRFQEDHGISVEKVNVVIRNSGPPANWKEGIVKKDSLNKKKSISNSSIFSRNPEPSTKTLLGKTLETSIQRFELKNRVDCKSTGLKVGNEKKDLNRSVESNIERKVLGHEPPGSYQDGNFIASRLLNPGMEKMHASRIEKVKIKRDSSRSDQDDQLDSKDEKKIHKDENEMKIALQRKDEEDTTETGKVSHEGAQDEITCCVSRPNQDRIDSKFRKSTCEEIRKSHKTEQRAGEVMNKALNVSEEKDSDSKSLQDEKFGTRKVKYEDKDVSIIRSKSLKMGKKSGNEVQRSEKVDEIKRYDPISNQDNQIWVKGFKKLDNETPTIEQSQKIIIKSDPALKKEHDFGFSVIKPIRTYSRSKYPPKNTILDSSSNAIFDSIKQSIKSHKINDSISLSNDKFSKQNSHKKCNKRKLYTPGVKVHLNDSLDNECNGESNYTKTKIFFSEKNENVKKKLSPTLFDYDSETDDDVGCVTNKYHRVIRRSKTTHELSNLPRKYYKEISEESSGSDFGENARKRRKLELADTSPNDKTGSSILSRDSNSSASTKKHRRKLLSYTHTKYGKPKTSNERRGMKLESSENLLIDDVKMNTDNNREVFITNGAASFRTDNMTGPNAKLDTLLENASKDSVPNLADEVKNAQDAISRMILNARTAVSEEITTSVKPYYDIVQKFKSGITSMENELKELTNLCSDIENTTDLVNKAISQPVSDKEMREFVNYLRENNYYLELNKEQANDKNLIAKINAYIDKSMNIE